MFYRMIKIVILLSCLVAVTVFLNGGYRSGASTAQGAIDRWLIAIQNSDFDMYISIQGGKFRPEMEEIRENDPEKVQKIFSELREAYGEAKIDCDPEREMDGYLYIYSFSNVHGDYPKKIWVACLGGYNWFVTNAPFYSTSNEQKPPRERKDDNNSTEPVGELKSEPDFITGLWHGLTSPLRFFGIFDLHYVITEEWTGSYALGVVIGCIVIVAMAIGHEFFKKNK